MNYNNLIDNNLTNYGIVCGIAFGIYLSYSFYNWIRNNSNDNTPINIEALTTEDINEGLTKKEGDEGFTNEEIDAIISDNADRVSVITDENIDAIIDTDSESDIASEYDIYFDDESVADIDIAELDLFFMPNVDFDVCPIQELKYYELTALYPNELAEKSITEEELMELLYYIPEEKLATNWINELILFIISHVE